MNLIEAAVLGLVQGITEFLPVSSTAHLRIFPALVGWPDPGAAFTAVLQLGTLAAVIAFFARDLAAMAAAGLGAIGNRERRRDPNARLLGHVVVGTLPVVVLGVLLRKAIKGELRALPVIAAAMIGVGIVLAIVERVARHERDIDRMTVRDAVIIGCAQALALIPGVSRSGITMAAAMAIGMKREAAARYSFLLSIPAVAGAGVFEMKELVHGGLGATPMLVGVVVAAVTGYASIAWLLRFLRTRTMIPFVIYRVVAGAAIFALLAAGLLRG